MRNIRKYSFVTATAALAVGAALVLTGCGSKTASTGSSTPAPTQGAAQGGGGQTGAGAGGGTSGEIAAISGQTLQVQDSSSQTAVTYDSSTTITKTVSTSLSAVTNGVCITASSFPAGGGAGGTAGSSGASGSSGSTSSAVTSVAITQAVDGKCDTGFGGAAAGGVRPSGAPTARPSVRPSNRPSGAAGSRGTFTAPTSGLVTGVSGSTITVDALDFQTQQTTSKTVTVDSSTKYTETQSADSSALVVGQCVLARGKSDDSGTVAATSLTVSAPSNGSCTSGFGGGRFGGAGRTGGAGGTGSGQQSGTTNG